MAERVRREQLLTQEEGSHFPSQQLPFCKTNTNTNTNENTQIQLLTQKEGFHFPPFLAPCKTSKSTACHEGEEELQSMSN